MAELRRRLADTAPPAFDPPTRSREGRSAGGAGGVAGAEVLAVPAPLDALLPLGGLPRGGIVSVQPETGADGSGLRSDASAVPSGGSSEGSSGGLTTLLFTLLAGPVKPWSALLGFGDLGFAAAAELGVDLDRTVVVPNPGGDVAHIVSVLLDGLDVIAVHCPGGPIGPPSRQRVLASRLRQRGAVLLAVGPWPGADLTLSVSTVGLVRARRGARPVARPGVAGPPRRPPDRRPHPRGADAAHGGAGPGAGAARVGIGRAPARSGAVGRRRLTTVGVNR